VPSLAHEPKRLSTTEFARLVGAVMPGYFAKTSKFEKHAQQALA